MPSRLERWDAKLLRETGSWRFAPPPSEPVCSRVTFAYTQR
jgi:hypothetical protein